MHEEKIERHAGKAERNDEPKDHAEQLNERRVFFVQEAKRLESGLKAVLQVIAQKNQGKDVKAVVHRTLKCLGDELIQRHFRIREPGRDKERIQVDDKKDEDDTSRPDRDPGCKGGVIFQSKLNVLVSPGCPVLPPHNDSQKGMQYQPCKEKDFDKADDRIVHQELCVRFVSLASIFFEKKQVAHKVFDQERTQEQSCQAHKDLLANRGFVECDEFAHKDSD